MEPENDVKEKDVEDGYIGPSIHVPGARVGAPDTDRQSYIPHTDTDMHTKYRNIHIPTKTHLPQYTSHVLTAHKLQTPH